MSLIKEQTFHNKVMIALVLDRMFDSNIIDNMRKTLNTEQYRRLKLILILEG
jgi:hypothetical protein